MTMRNEITIKKLESPKIPAFFMFDETAIPSIQIPPPAKANEG